mmetsp:Transcript_4836/g.6994  ORF Transcript_4836/g.6994 Transcript_4836/m.6994 type:complete len:482 (+) Transcript_4836:102-1547(+)
MADSSDYFAVPEKTSSTKTAGDHQPSPVGLPKINISHDNTPRRVSNRNNLEGRNAAAPTKTPEQSSKAFSLDEANEEVALLLQSGKVSQREVQSLQGMMRDHAMLKDKVDKLKSLLGRSAKAQREAKLNLESTQKKLEIAMQENQSLKAKVDHLANRPTHMDLLADFETNFDKALLSVGTSNQQQSGGENTAPNATTSLQQDTHQQQQVVDSMLMQELSESQTRMERLESINKSLVHRSNLLEQESKKLQQERDAATLKVDRLTLELRMSNFEAEKATRAMQDKLQSLQEMQLEIDLVTKASMDANVRATKGEEAAKSVQTDREQVKQLQAQVQALQEWALASAESKRLCQERVRILENKVKTYEEIKDPSSKAPSRERIILRKASSLVIGAGDIGYVSLNLKECADQLKQGDRVLLRWRFDITPAELGVDFSLLKGICDTAPKQLRADYLIKNRYVFNILARVSFLGLLQPSIKYAFWGM